MLLVNGVRTLADVIANPIRIDLVWQATFSCGVVTTIELK
jgi:hypothetical protein